MNQGYSNRFVAKIVYSCECLAKILLYEQVANFMSSNSLSTDYLDALSMMTPEEMRTRYLISENDSVAFNRPRQQVVIMLNNLRLLKSCIKSKNKIELKFCSLVSGGS